MTIVNLSNVYLRAFIPEGEIGRVRAGQSAEIFLDSNPKQPLEAVVARIDPRLRLRLKTLTTRDDRVKQVVGVKLQLTNSQGFAKPGRPRRRRGAGRRRQMGGDQSDIDRFANACTGLWRELFTRACFLIGQSHKQGD